MKAKEYIQTFKRASLLFEEGHLNEVLNICNELKKENPERMGAYLLISQVHLKKNKPLLAVAVLEEGIDNSDELPLKINLAIVLSQMGDNQKAALWFKRAEKDAPQNPQFWFYYAKNSVVLGLIPKAISLYEKCLKLKENHKAALNNLANLHQKAERYELAERYYRKLIQYYPNEGMAFSNLASLLERRGKTNDAVEYYTKALEIDPDLSIAYYNLGQIYAGANKDYKKALEIYERGLKCEDKTYYKGIRFFQIICKQHIIDWSEFEKDTNDLNDILEWYIDEQRPPFEIVPYALSYSNVDPSLYKQVAEKYAAKIEKEVKNRYPDVVYDHTLSEGKIRIGYLSPNFRIHPGGTLVREVFDKHESRRFEVHAFSLVHTEDWINKEIQDSVDYYHDVSKLTTIEIADLINRLGIDVLVALAGYNSSMKMGVLALRPAPIQMVIVGSHETTGAGFVDYIFSDEYMHDAEIRENFSEKVITLPCSLLLNSRFPLEGVGNTDRHQHGLAEDAFVFANFNHPKKLDPETFETWIQILLKVPNSVLWLYNAGQENFETRIREEARLLGLDEDRIVFAKPMEIRNHWERMHHADLFLDNFVYNAHVTGIEALRMGVPMITLKGKTHNSRLSSSLLKFSNLEKLICLAKNDYIRMSIKLATSAAELENARKKLQVPDNVMLFDTELQVRYLEKAYQKAILKFRKGLTPEDFKVGSALKLDAFN